MIAKITIFLALISICSISHAEEQIIRLIFSHEYTVDAITGSSKGKTSGEDLVTVTVLDDEKVSIKKEGLGALYSGTISEEEINGKTEYKIGEAKVTEFIKINRYTGKSTMSYMIGDGGLIHFGTCRIATKKLF